MIKFFKKNINKWINHLGYQIVPKSNYIPKVRSKHWLELLDIKEIIDVGANEGQFINEIIKILPNRKIFAFEPISDCFNKLEKNTEHLNVELFNFGLSDKEEEVEINISKNQASSSILEMRELHLNSFPNTTYIKKEVIKLKRLDDIINLHKLKTNYLAKIDVQGYEKFVLLGGENIFGNASAIIIEITFEPFYENQWLFEDIHTYLNKREFKFLGFIEQFTSIQSGIPLYADAIFVKKELISKLY